ncbi:hypothetical protein ACFPVX_23700 [Cohnella faecalis]|uniref:Sporulation membrane protein YtrI C-terminal domain-containing protein n=1 Tax=Cohnella faecalis TaxID=2315694 RepID=A0A398CHZ1_9BACL|nr:hypothetical protein [Cohnella faecalis]RIE02876.1 hypothetical protein D3H35_19845 [Cohnella faecalis]
MRVPSFEKFQRFTGAAAIFVCGCIVGAAAFNGLANGQLDKAIQRNYELRDQLNDLDSKLRQANQFKSKQTVIKTIRPFIESPQGKTDLDIVTETELKNRLKNDLSIFLGRSIYTIDSDALLARKLLARKIYVDIGGKDYAVSVKTILVVEQELQVWAEAEVHLRT